MKLFFMPAKRSIKVALLLLVTVAFLLGGNPAASAVAAPEQEIVQVPLSAPGVFVGLNLPGRVTLGDDFSFTVTFDNDGVDTGYGPFIDLLIPVNGADGDYNRAAKDGIDFVSAEALGYTFSAADDTLNVQTFPNPPGSPAPIYPDDYITCVDHPWAVDSTNTPLPVCGPAGDKFVSLRLPFGSFTPSQPQVVVTVNAAMSNLADINTPLTVKARGGYMFGATPLDDWCCGDPTIVIPTENDGTGWPTGSTEPSLIQVSKSYLGPGNTQAETATGPNYRRQYEIHVDLAAGQQFINLTITEYLPDNVAYVSFSATGGYVTPLPAGDEPIPGVASNPPDNDLVLRWPAITGVDGDDITITVDFFIPQLDANGNPVIDPSSGDDATSDNIAWAQADWTPLDSRDAPATITSDDTCPVCPPLHSLQDKSIAIQKSVGDVTDGNVSPGDVLEYTLTFQISDFFAFGSVVITDVISDGQHFNAGFTPTLEVNESSFSLPAADMNADNYDIACNYSGAGAECEFDDGAPYDGTTTLTFRISDELVTRGRSGNMLGGRIDPAYFEATTGRLVFQTIIQDEFTDDFPSLDRSVDQGDVLNDLATIEGNVLEPSGFTAVGDESDGATARAQIDREELSKSIYAINGDANPAHWSTSGGQIEIKPSDEITFRLLYKLNTSDVEDLALDDYLPLPIFFVGDSDDTDYSAPKHQDGPAWVFDDVINANAPLTGHAKFGPTDTFRPYSGIVPSIAADDSNNKLTFTYGDYDNPANQPTTIDLLFTVTVVKEPFADQLFLTNLAHAYEGSTQGSSSTANALLQMVVTEPIMSSSKGVVWTNSPTRIFDPANTGPAGVAFRAPANSPRWTGTINSSGLDSRPIDSDISGVDAGDIVTFAITLENSGTSLAGAFDLILRDAIPAIYDIPATAEGLNLQVYYGNGMGPIDFRGLGAGCTGAWPGDPCGPDHTADTADDLFGNGIELIDPVGQGVCQAHDPNLGNNVILITYDLQIKSSVTPGTYTNTQVLTNYAGSEGGPSHITSSGGTFPDNYPDVVWGVPIKDDANVTVNAAPSKYLVATSEPDTITAGANVAIGEIVRYRLVVRIPEGSSPNVQFRDLLPNGLIFLNDSSAKVAFVSDDDIVSSGTGIVPAIPAGCNMDGKTADATTPLSSDITCTLEDENIGSTNRTDVNDDSYGNGTDPYFKLGDLINSDNDDDGEYAIVEFNALVHNASANQNDDGDVLGNTVQTFIGGVQSGSDSERVDITVREPFLTLAKTNSAISAAVDAGDTVTYTVTIENPSATSHATAFDVRFVDVLNVSYLTLLPASITVTAPSSYTIDKPDLIAPNTIDITIASIPLDNHVTITYQATIKDAVNPGQAVDNRGDSTWTSLPGPNGTVSNATGSVTPGPSGSNTGERDGAGGAINDHQANAASSFHIVTDPFFSKSIELTDVVPSDANTAIGEVVTFGLLVTLPEGTTPSLHLVDVLPHGMAYFDDPAGPDAYDLVTTSPPASCGSLAADFGGTAPAPTLTVTPAAGGDSATLTFDFGAVTVNGDGNTDNNTFLICFRAVVENIGDNQAGDDLTNTATAQIGTGTVFTDTEIVHIIEPVLRIDKLVDELFPIPGQVLNFTLTIDHDAASTADAYDVIVFDDLPANLTLDLASITTIPAVGMGVITDHSSGNHVEVWADALPMGNTLEVRFQATFIGALGDRLANTGNITWTSKPGTDLNERTGGGGDNDYAADDDVGLANTREIHKSLIATNHPNTVLPDAAIGEILTYQVVLTVPADSTDIALVTDTLDSGLAFVSCSDITAGPNITSSNIDFTAAGNCNAGITLAHNPQVLNSGQVIKFDFGTVRNVNPAATETITMTYQAVVLDVVSNTGGVQLDNDVEWKWNTASLRASAPRVTIRESDLSLEKTVDPIVALPGASVTYTLLVQHTPQSQADAFDLVLTDIFPEGLEFTGGTPIVTTARGQAPDALSYDPLTRTLLVHWDNFLLGAQSELHVPAQLSSSLGRGTTVNNEASLAWSSLPGDISAPQSAFNAASTERRYDPLNPADFYVTGSSASLRIPTLPKTGFAPGKVTPLPQQPGDFSYAALGDLWLEIPGLQVKVNILGVPFKDQNWNLTWLEKQAGYLEGTAYPTHDGNTGVTAHAYLADGSPGPFASLDKLRYGDQIIVHLGGQRYIYEVRENQLVRPNDLSILKHEKYPWLTLLTCKAYNASTDDYQFRVSVRAVLVRVEKE